MAFFVDSRFVLCELRNRGETVDTIIHCISNDYELLTDIMLSFYDALYEKMINNDWICREHPKECQKYCINYMKNFRIVRVAYMED